jgi:hypothetical protein
MTTKTIFYTSVLAVISIRTFAQDVQLHVSPRWEQCSFQLDPSLTQQQWHEFAQEAAMVVCFRPLTDAKPMGARRFEVSVLQWKTRIDETKGAWNNTFVHPNAEHYLVGGDELPFPGLSLRAGLTSKMDAGVYWSCRPGANYGFAGAQIQYNFFTGGRRQVDVSSRIGCNVLYGPEDVNFVVSALDVLASKTFTIDAKWLTFSPYAGPSLYLSHAHEKTDRVALHDENVMALQGMAGVVAGIRGFKVAAEYNMAKVNTFSFRLGYNFKL